MRRGHLGSTVGVALLTLGLGTGVVQAQQSATVSMTEFQFAPARLTATVGQPVNWTFKNDGQNPHDFRVEIGGQTIDAAPGDGNVASGQSATLTQTFTTPGTYEFWCPVGQHRARGMVGQLVVVAAGAAAPAAPAAPTAPPAAAPAAPAPAPAAAAPAPQPAPAQAPRALPRTGELPLSPVELLAGMAGLGSLVTGLIVRGRRRN